MNIKELLIKLAEEQAEKMQEEAVKHLGSDEMSDKIATAINKRIDIPFVSEEKEQILGNLTAMEEKYDEAIAQNTSLSDELKIEKFTCCIAEWMLG